MNYFDRPEISHSQIKRIDLGYNYFKQDFVSTPQMREGTILHEYILEDKEFIEGDYKTFCKSLKDNEVPKGYLETMKILKDRVFNHPEARFLEGKKETELYGEREGFQIKGKLDVIGDTYITDFKTTNSISKWIKNGFINEWSILNYSYHTQLEWYRYLEGNCKDVKLFVLALQEKEVFCINLNHFMDYAKGVNEERLNKLKIYQAAEELDGKVYMFDHEVELFTPFAKN